MGTIKNRTRTSAYNHRRGELLRTKKYLQAIQPPQGCTLRRNQASQAPIALTLQFSASILAAAALFLGRILQAYLALE